MQRLVRGEGLEVLGAQKEATHQAVEKGLVGVTGTSWNQVLKPGEIPMPSLGTRTKPFDASKPAGISLRAANEELTRVGDMLHGRLPLDPRYREVPIDKLYAQLRKEIGDGIELAGGTQGPALRAMWETGQTNYHRGRQLYDWLRDTTGLIDNNGYLNMRVLQKTLKDDPQKVAKLVDAIGPDDYKKLENAVFRGAFPMKTDRPITGEGGHLSALRQFFRREGGEGSLRSIQIPVLTLFPNTGQYVGKVPQRAVPEVLQRGVTGFSQSVGINPENQPHPVTAGAQKGAAKTGSGLQEAARLWTLGARRILPASLFQ
jgi:hypothetical protein